MLEARKIAALNDLALDSLIITEIAIALFDKLAGKSFSAFQEALSEKIHIIKNGEA